MNLSYFLSISMLAAGLCGCGPEEGTEDVDPLELTELEEGASSNAVSLWWPLQDGNRWTLASSSGATGTEITFDGTGTRKGSLEGLFDDALKLSFASATSTTLNATNPQTNKSVAFMRFGYTSKSWKFSPTGDNGPCDTYVIQRASTSETVKTPAGTFTNVRSYTLAPVGGPTVKCAAPPYFEMAFAPGVGPVRLKTGSNKTWLLIDATVQGGSVAPTDLVGTLTSNKLTYTNKPNSIVCITTPCPSNEKTASAKFSFSIENRSSVATQLNFNTGCQYDLELVNSSGKVLRRLSEERFCTMALSTLKLSAGGQKTFSETLELHDRDGVQLKPGRYTARAKLIPNSGPGATASAAFVVVP